MKILTTISYYKPYISGLTICARRLIEGLAERGLEFTVLTSRYKQDLPLVETKNRIVVCRLPVWGVIGKVPVMPGYLKTLIDQIRRVDLVWIHLPQGEGLITAIAARVFKKRVVATLHCLPLLPSGWHRFLFQRGFDLINNLVILLADRIVYYTKDYAENIKELWHFPKKSSYILPPVPAAGERQIRSFNRQQGSDLSAACSRRRGGRGLAVGFAGRIAEDKGLEYLIEAIQLMKEGAKDVRLIIAGSKEAVGESRYVDKIYSLIDESGIEVEFLGVIEPEKMGDFYSKIDVLVLPSVNRTEAFGMVQAEAMTHGVPVVATNLPGVRIPIKLTAAGRTVAPKDPAALAEAITDIRQRPPDKNKISRLARQVFSPRRCLSQYAKIFRTYASTRSSRLVL